MHIHVSRGAIFNADNGQMSTLIAAVKEKEIAVIYNKVVIIRSVLV